MLRPSGNGDRRLGRLLQWAVAVIFVSFSCFFGLGELWQDSRVRFLWGPPGRISGEVEQLGSRFRAEGLADSVLLITDDSDADANLVWRIAFCPITVYKIGFKEYAQTGDSLIQKYPRSLIFILGRPTPTKPPAFCQPIPGFSAGTILQCSAYEPRT
jgi:hypothetical protein